MAKAKMQNKAWDWCGSWGKKKFPTFSVLLLLIGAVWLLSEIGVITVQIPWWPVIIIALALRGIIDYIAKNK